MQTRLARKNRSKREALEGLEEVPKELFLEKQSPLREGGDHEKGDDLPSSLDLDERNPGHNNNTTWADVATNQSYYSPKERVRMRSGSNSVCQESSSAQRMLSESSEHSHAFTNVRPNSRKSRSNFHVCSPQNGQSTVHTNVRSKFSAHDALQEGRQFNSCNQSISQRSSHQQTTEQTTQRTSLETGRHRPTLNDSTRCIIKPLPLTTLTVANISKFLRDTRDLTCQDFSRLISAELYEELNGRYGDEYFDREGLNMRGMREKLEIHRKMLKRLGPGVSTSIRELRLGDENAKYLEEQVDNFLIKCKRVKQKIDETGGCHDHNTSVTLATENTRVQLLAEGRVVYGEGDTTKELILWK